VEAIQEFLSSMSGIQWVIIGGGFLLLFGGKQLKAFAGNFTKKAPAKFDLENPQDLGDYVRLLQPHQKLLASSEKGSTAITNVFAALTAYFTEKAKADVLKELAEAQNPTPPPKPGSGPR